MMPSAGTDEAMSEMDDDLLPVRVLSGPQFTSPPGATWTSALVIGDEVVVSGLTARGGDGVIAGGDDLGQQVRAIFARLVGMMEAAGGHVGNIYKLVIYVTDISKRADINDARAGIFGPVYPCSTLVEIKALAAPGMLVEVDAFANLRVDLRAATTQ
jgi:2-iminobutanoate/2-iminopropanoate deaminase